jgi:3-hydroxybutyryl-CoA dehydrogenase
MEIRNVGVLGCGLMGSGIAQVCATAGFPTLVLEAADEIWKRGFQNIEKRLARLVEKGELPADKPPEIRGRLAGTTRMEELADCDLVIEAIIENRQQKLDTYRRLDAIVQPKAIFASNTSSLSITDMMTATSRQDRFVGMHFFNPVPVMKLIEVVKTVATDPEIYETVVKFGQCLGKTPVRTSDKTGFIVNRLLVPYMLDAVRAYEEGVGSVQDIDNAMKLGCGHPMGPLTLLDFVGLDTTYYISEIMFDEFHEARFASPSLLKRLVQAGWYGRKSGRGFYDYKDPQNPQPLDRFLR